MKTDQHIILILGLFRPRKRPVRKKRKRVLCQTYGLFCDFLEGQETKELNALTAQMRDYSYFQ